MLPYPINVITGHALEFIKRHYAELKEANDPRPVSVARTGKSHKNGIGDIGTILYFYHKKYFQMRRTRHLATAFLFCLLGHTATAQEYSTFTVDGKMGINHWSGSKTEKIVKAKYQDIKIFGNGTAALRLKDKWAIHGLGSDGSSEMTEHIYDTFRVMSDYSRGKFVFMTLQKDGLQYVTKLTSTAITGLDKPYKTAEITGAEIIAGEPGNYTLYTVYKPGSPYDLYTSEIGTIQYYSKMGISTYYKTSTGNYITRYTDKEAYTRVDSAWEDSQKNRFISLNGKRLKYSTQNNPPKWLNADVDIVEGRYGVFVTRKDGQYGLMGSDDQELVKPAYSSYEYADIGSATNLFFFTGNEEMCIYNVAKRSMGCSGRKVIKKDVSRNFVFLLTADNLWHLYNPYGGTIGDEGFKSINVKEFTAVCTQTNGSLVEYDKNLARTAKAIDPRDTMKFKGEQVVKVTPTGFTFFKTPTGMGVRSTDGLVFPPVFDNLEPLYQSTTNTTEQRVKAQYGSYEIEGFLMGKAISGEITCNACWGGGTYKQDYHIKGDVIKKERTSYLGNGVYEKTTFYVKEPDQNFTLNAACIRCEGKGTMKGTISYGTGELRLTYWKDDMERYRQER